MVSELIKKLISEGWEKRFTASGDKLREAIENYEWLGFEVKAIPARELGCGECTNCFDDQSDNSMMIFTRQKGGRNSEDIPE